MTWTDVSDETTLTWTEDSSVTVLTFTEVTRTVITGNASRFVGMVPLVVASEVDFNNTFSTLNPWVFTTSYPITFTVNRNDPV